MDAINGKNRRIVTALHEVESLGVKSRNSSIYGDLVVNRLSMELIIRGDIHNLVLQGIMP